MRTSRNVTSAVMVSAICACAPTEANAAEYAFSTYGLGSAAFGAGITPPPGTYVSFSSAFYDGDISGALPFGGIVLNLGVKAKFLVSAINGLYVPKRKVLDGKLGLSVTVPVGHTDLEADVTGPLGNTVRREEDGAGLGDINARIQLGWDRTDFSHTVYMQVVAPTGRYEAGFEPIVGLHRPGIDIGSAFTWTEKTSKLQFNGSTGVTVNFENTETDYDSGTDFHFEWAIGREISKGLVIGVVGYDYRQLTGDSGAGARLGPFEGEVDAIGAGLQYTTTIRKMPVTFNARHYEEYNAERHLEGSMSIVSGTIRY